MKIRLIPLILLLAACNPQSDTTQTIQPTASQPVRQTASAPDNAENQALTNEQIRKQAAEQVLQYAQARHCGNATLVAAEQASLDNTDKLNPAEAAIILDTSKHEDSQESLIAVLYHSDATAADITLPRKGDAGLKFYGCGLASATSSYHLQLATYNTSIDAGSGVSENDLFNLIDKANSDAQAKHKNEPNGNPYFINPRFIDSVKKQGDHLEIISAQHVGTDSMNFPSARWQYTVHLLDLKITSSQYLGKIDYNN